MACASTSWPRAHRLSALPMRWPPMGSHSGWLPRRTASGPASLVGRGRVRDARRSSAMANAEMPDGLMRDVDMPDAALPGRLVSRPRRLRRTPALRRLVAQTRLSASDLVLPLFVKEGITEPAPIASMPGVVQHTRDSVRKAAAEAVADGVGGLILFGIPAHKDALGTGADDPSGIVQVALRDLVSEVGDTTVLMADLCLDEYTDHGHCGILTEAGEVANDATLERYASIAVAQARAGAHVVAPSGMMDGQVAAIRGALDDGGFPDVAICAYAAKYASAFYGPFRDAAECAPRFGDRASYQQDHGSAVEAL